MVAVQASKICTYLQQFGKKGILPQNTMLTYLNPLRLFSCKGKLKSVSLSTLKFVIFIYSNFVSFFNTLKNKNTKNKKNIRLT